MKSRFAIILSALLIASTAAAEPPQRVDAATHTAITQVLTDIAAGADRHDWSRVRAAMADQITTDYSSLFGGDSITQSSADLMKVWAGFLPGFDSTHHIVTNHSVIQVDGDQATAEADFIATHRLGQDLWVLGGRYRYGLQRSGKDWVVASITMTALWETGDRTDLIQRAMARGKSR